MINPLKHTHTKIKIDINKFHYNVKKYYNTVDFSDNPMLIKIMNSNDFSLHFGSILAVFVIASIL